MSELVFPATLDALDGLIVAEEQPSAAELAQRLRVLQRLGMTKTELTVHIERLRAMNDVSGEREQVEDNAVLALELVEGSTRLGLEWVPGEVAAAWLPRALSQENLESGIDAALAPSDLLPARPTFQAENDLPARMALQQWLELSRRAYKPTIADFFRSPKAGLTTRPAALLSPQDRLVYEAFAEALAPRMASVCPPHVVWPRDRTPRGNYSEFAEAPCSWDVEFVVRTDIASYYESIDHAFLAVVLGRTLGTGGAFGIALEAFLDTVMNSTVGLPQGPAASDVLASAYLTDIDLELEHRGWPVMRYADDLLIGADSFAQARMRLRDLETLLRERGLLLSNEKTRVIRAKTYIRTLEEPTEKLGFRRVVQRDVEEWLEDHPQAHDDEILRGVGLSEESLWDLLYHETITLTDALAQVKDRLLPPWIDAYQRVFTTEAQRLGGGGYADDSGALTTGELRECLLFMAAGARSTDLKDLDAVLNWHPTLVRHVSEYLAALGETEPQSVADFLTSRMATGLDSDLELAWLLDAAVRRSPIAEAMPEALITISQAVSIPLARTTATRALAATGQLTSERWDNVLTSSSPAMRAELLLAREADPQFYPNGPKMLSLDDGWPPE